SRVTPGWSWTMLMRLPMSALRRLLLPTLGRPTMAITGGRLLGDGMAGVVVREWRRGGKPWNSGCSGQTVQPLQSVLCAVDVDLRGSGRCNAEIRRREGSEGRRRRGNCAKIPKTPKAQSAMAISFSADPEGRADATASNTTRFAM